jgi:hypothetical protein
MRTNLHDIIQDSDERIPILETKCHVSRSLSIVSPQNSRTSTYSWSIWNLGHLDLIIMTVLRIVVVVIGKGFGCCPDGNSPEQAALCSKASDEDALVHCRG